MRSILAAAALLFLALPTHSTSARQSAGFFHTEGGQILDGEGNATFVRGIGLGGWLMPEGYMLHMGSVGGASDMRLATEDLIGKADSDQFWDMYRALYVAEKDVAAMAAWGFDHVRLPFHYNVFFDIESGLFKEDGFQLLDDFLGWCDTHDLDVILDLHGAPGAQSDGDIADSDGTARLWTEPVPYQDLTVQLWEEIARRYVDNTRIVGYDLINEPVTPNSVPDGAQALRDLYERLAIAIRAIDPNHILFIEGNYFATTLDKLTPPFDSNMVYAFHKYWNAPNIGTIQYILNLRSDHGVPLWLGEWGENSNPWFHEVVRLAEDNEVGCNFWTHKQIQSTVAPLSAEIKPGFRRVLDYWNGRATRPSADFARDALFEMAHGLDIDSTTVHPDVLGALFDSDFGTSRTPWAVHTIPGVVDAVKYDLGNQGTTYSDSDPWAVTGAPGGGNSGSRYRNDGVDIEASTDPLGFGFNVGFMEPLEWMEYTVNVQTTGTYDVDLRVASLGGGGDFSLSIDGSRLGAISVPNTAGWQNWVSAPLNGVALEAGQRRLRIAVGRKGSFNLNRLTFSLATSTATEAAAPDAFHLSALFPHPASGSSHATLTLPAAGAVRLQVIDLLGREVIAKRAMYTAGENQIEIDVASLPAGTYLLSLVFEDRGLEQRVARPLVVVR